MSAVIFSGPKVKTLKKALTLNEAGEEFFTVFGEDGVDPRSSGVAAPEGSLLVDKSNGKWFKKVGPGDTAWVYMQEEPEEDNEYLDYESSNFSTRDGVASIGSWTESDDTKLSIGTTATDPFFGSHSGLITKLAVDAVNAYLPVASAVIPRGNRGKPIIIKMSADFTHADYTSEDLEFQLWDITGTPEQIYVAGDVKVKKAKGDIILVGYPESDVEQVELRAVIATDSATSSSWTGKIDRVQLGPDKLVPSLFHRVQEISLASSGDFTAGTIRVSRVGSQVTVSILTSLTYSASTDSQVSAAGLIPSWARPTANVANIIITSPTAVTRFDTNADGSILTRVRDWSGGGLSTSSVGSGSISYTVPDTESPLISTTEALFKTGSTTVRRTTNQTFTISTATKVEFNTILTDDLGFNTSTNDLTIKKPGKYLLSCSLLIGGTTANANNQATIRVNGTNIARGISATSSASTPVTASVAGVVVDLAVGDVVEVRVFSARSSPFIDTAGADQNWFSVTRLPDLSVYGVQGQVEILSAESAEKSGITSATWLQMSGNSLPLTPGIWRLAPAEINFSQTGAMTYTRCLGAWRSANGDDTATAPTSLQGSGAISVLSSNNGGWIDQRNLSTGVLRLLTPEYIVRVNAPVSVFACPFAEATGTLANARVSARFHAERIA